MLLCLHLINCDVYLRVHDITRLFCNALYKSKYGFSTVCCSLTQQCGDAENAKDEKFAGDGVQSRADAAETTHGAHDRVLSAETATVDDTRRA